MTVVTTDEDLDEEKIKNPDKELQYPFTYCDNYVQRFTSIIKDYVLYIYCTCRVTSFVFTCVSVCNGSQP